MGCTKIFKGYHNIRETGIAILLPNKKIYTNSQAVEIGEWELKRRKKEKERDFTWIGVIQGLCITQTSAFEIHNEGDKII